jgi:hypothetical protein
MKLYKTFDQNYIDRLVVYPAWEGPQIVFIIDWASIGTLDYKILRRKRTFPESHLIGDVIRDSTTDTDVHIINDLDCLENSWNYYSIFIFDGSWKRIADIESFSFGINWAKSDLWDHHIPDFPYKIDDALSEKKVLRESYADYIEGQEINEIDEVDPQKVLIGENGTVFYHQLRRYIKYLSHEIDNYADLVNSYPKLFRIDTMPLFMLEAVSELVKMEFKCDFSPIYKRQLIRFSIHRARRKGTNLIIRWISRLISQVRWVYIHEFGRNVLYWNDVGNVPGKYGESNTVTNAFGSFWGSTSVGMFKAFGDDSYLIDTSDDKLISPYVHGIFISVNVGKNVPGSTLNILMYYLEKNVAWINKWFVGLIQPNTHIMSDNPGKEIKLDVYWRDLNYNIVSWTFTDTGWTDKTAFLP